MGSACFFFLHSFFLVLVYLCQFVRCNPDVARRLTSGGYEDKVDVITPINILFIGVGEFDPSWR